MPIQRLACTLHTRQLWPFSSGWDLDILQARSELIDGDRPAGIIKSIDLDSVFMFQPVLLCASYRD